MKKINGIILAIPFLMHSMCIRADYAHKSIMKNFSGKDTTAVQIFNAQDQVTGEINTPTAKVKGMTQGTSKDFRHDDIAKFVVYDVNNGVLDTSHPYVTLASEISGAPTINYRAAFFIDTDKKVKNSMTFNCNNSPENNIGPDECMEKCRNHKFWHHDTVYGETADIIESRTCYCCD